MKRAAFVFLILALVVVGALFAATSNADRYRPLIEKKLSKALGYPVIFPSQEDFSYLFPSQME